MQSEKEVFYMMIANAISSKKIIFGIFVLFACLFYLDKIVLGPYAPVRIHDSFHLEFLRYRATGNLFLNHGFFAWLPNVFGGMPSYAHHFAPYYVLSILSAFVPSWLLYSVMVILLMAIAGFGMCWFLNEFLNVGLGLSLAGGLFFSLYTQVQQNAIIHVVFNYVFPAFFMCLVGSRYYKNTSLVKIASFALVLSSLLVSYPILTFPMFFVMQFLVIYLLDFQKKESKNELIVRTFLVWIGYILLCLPVLYGVYVFVPFCQRQYEPPVSVIRLLAYFKTPFWNHLIFALKDSGIFFFTIGFIPLLYYSERMRKAFLLFLLPLFVATFFSCPSLGFLSQSIFEKMDLSHFIWTLPFAFTVFVVIGLQELFSGKFPKFLYYVCFLMAGLFYVVVVIRKGITVINPINFTVPLLAGSIYFCKKTIDIKNRGVVSYTKILLSIFVISLFLVAIMQFRLIRLPDESVPYRRFFDSHSIFTFLKEKENGTPFRVGTLSDMPMITQSYGIETVDGRGPIQPKYYKEYFREIIRPQFKTDKDECYFNTYWYQLYLRDPRFFREYSDKKENGILLNMPLLLMINTKYVVSWSRDSYLDSVSEKVIESKCDSLVRPGFMDRFLREISFIIKSPVLKTFVGKDLKEKNIDSLFEWVNCPTLFIYRLKDAFERGYVAKNAIILPSDGDILNALAKQPIGAFKENVFFSAQDSAALGAFLKKQKDFSKNNDYKLRIKYYSPDRIVFDGVVSFPCILVVTNNYHPNWCATVNGKKTKIYRANHAFQAICIEDIGKFRSVFEYHDPMLWKTHYAIPFGLVLILISVFYTGRASSTKSRHK